MTRGIKIKSGESKIYGDILQLFSKSYSNVCLSKMKPNPGNLAKHKHWNKGEKAFLAPSVGEI